MQSTTSANCSVFLNNKHETKETRASDTPCVTVTAVQQKGLCLGSSDSRHSTGTQKPHFLALKYKKFSCCARTLPCGPLKPTCKFMHV